MLAHDRVSPPAPPRSLPPLALWPLLALVAVKLVLHASCIAQYGWFRDELYYMTCANHPAAGYVDQHPCRSGSRSGASAWTAGATGRCWE